MNIDVATWTEDHHAVWNRIESHPIGGAAAREFVARLQREQRWSDAQVHDALREYRRFVFLACVARNEATPSKAVDAVWHLHLLYTRDYWQTFCPQVLCTDLHHDPSGGAEHAPRYRDQYAQTLASYARWFGPPSPTWWPTRKATFPAPSIPSSAVAKPRRAMRFALPLFGAAVPALVLAARPADPLEWSGGDFLRLYALLMLIAAVAGLILRAWLRRRTSLSNRHVGALSPVEAAYLAGGPQRAIDAAIADLHAQGAVEWDATNRRLVRTEAARDLRPPLDGIARAMLDQSDLMTSIRVAAEALKPVQIDLERRGLWLKREDARRIGKFAALPAVVVCAFGLVKIVFGIARDKPISYLAAMCALTAVLALFLYFVRPGRSRLGDQEVAKLQAMHVAPRGVHPEPSQLAFAVALGGTTVLAGTALAAYHDARWAHVGNSSGDGSTSSWSSDSSNRNDADSSSDSGGDSGSDGGSSGCGGCGGGGGD